MSARAFASRSPRHARGPVRGARQRGYTLLEVIVAFALLAMALTLLLGSLSGAAKQVRWSSDAGRAALYAQSLMDQVGVGQPVRPGQRSGEFENGRYRWTLGIAPWRDSQLPPSNQPIDPNAMRLFEVQLAVEWGEGGGGRRLLLRTLRSGNAGNEAQL
ncbi:type II secretion system protein XpsI [Lysobacter enzymogenes]|uniref:Prepilin-type N-terminal cleavage/methylation domain-containing protein n=1 Tax=Lysobacter enzymogenes TaxID=69 RepID=A0A3N2RJN1_LYSEN|nr:prepilin-type N-terminal cleavage/methylation domain-containing protein [Lysobacter enzymogenes]ROU07688.1 prepilin-type N-terminal cleavage/methylation domain-containing protein [Lysobacter enzymogenes]